MAAVVIGLTLTLTFGLGHRSLLEETEIALAIVAAVLLVFLAVGLYHGVRVQKQREFAWGDYAVILGRDYKIGAPADVAGEVAVEGTMRGVLTGELEGCIFGVVIGVGMALLMLGVWLIVWLVAPLVWSLVALTAMAVYWVFYLALRRAFVLSRRCRGQLAPSLGYAAIFTCLYTGWLFVLLLAVRWITESS